MVVKSLRSTNWFKISMFFINDSPVKTWKMYKYRKNIVRYTIPEMARRASLRQQQRRERLQSQTGARAKPARKDGEQTNNSGEDSEGDEENRYCICRGYDDGTFMLACDTCDEWYHGRCVGVNRQQVTQLEKYVCFACLKKG
jgi:hypothetical protein